MAKQINTENVKSNKGRVLADLSGQPAALGNTIPGNATKPVKVVLGENALGYDTALTAALMSTFQGLLTALDDKPQILIEDMDTGHAHPSTMDNDLKYLLSGFLSIINRKQRGETVITKKSLDGKTVIGKQRIYNNKERMEYSLQKVEAMTEMMGKEDFQTVYYKEVNVARYDAYEDLFYGLAMAYRHIFNEDWKPVEQDRTETTKNSFKVDDTEANKWLMKAKSRAA